MPFNKFNLSKKILKAISDQGYTKPTPIQSQAIPVILNNKDVLGSAQTGTGKTAGFTLPLLQRLTDITQNVKEKRKVVRALILTPTRELAIQVEDSVSIYGKYLPLKSTAIYGGVSIKPQLKALKQGIDIVVATPGRLLDHLNQKNIDLSNVNMFILDEADRMLDMGFINDIRKVMEKLPKKRQNLLFSATFSKEIKHLADRLLNAPILIEVAKRNAPSEIVKQLVHPVDKSKKSELLYHLIADGNWDQVLVFTRTKHGANKLTEKLSKDGISATAIHGNKSQGARTKALSQFKNGGVRVLVATDVAARGIDIDQLPHVVNFELPNVPEDYVHRIGRTGRAGNLGVAVSLVCVDEMYFLHDIEKLLKKEIPKKVVVGFEPDRSIRAQPIRLGRSQSKAKKTTFSRSKPATGKGRSFGVERTTRSRGNSTRSNLRDDNVLSRTRTRTSANDIFVTDSKRSKTRDSFSETGAIKGRVRTRASAGDSLNTYGRKTRSTVTSTRKRPTVDRSGNSSRPTSGNVKTPSGSANKRTGSSFKPKIATKRSFSKPKSRT